MNILRTIAITLSTIALASISATAATTTAKDINFYDCETSNGMINFCSDKAKKTIAKLGDRKPNYNKDFVLMRFWDKEMEYWTYLALDKRTNTAYPASHGIRKSSGNPRDISMKIEGDKICSTGDQTSFVGSREYPSFMDSTNDVDYCIVFEPDVGLTIHSVIDAKTRKFIEWV